MSPPGKGTARTTLEAGEGSGRRGTASSPRWRVLLPDPAQRRRERHRPLRGRPFRLNSHDSIDVAEVAFVRLELLHIIGGSVFTEAARLGDDIVEGLIDVMRHA